jgi:signal transduction histidine kinase
MLKNKGDVTKVKLLPKQGSPQFFVPTMAMVLLFVAAIVRAFARGEIPEKMPLYLAAWLAVLVLYALAMLLPAIPSAVRGLIFCSQSGLILSMLTLYPEYDFTNLLYVPLVYQITIWYSGRTRWAALFSVVALTGGSLMIFLGWVRGLSLGFTYMAAEVVIAGFTVAFMDLEETRSASQVVLAELQDTHRQLELYASQVEELAAMEEHNRLSRELHDSVSQTLFSITLGTRSAQILLAKDPERARVQLEKLHELTQSGLTNMRELISQLKPKEEIPPSSP